MLTLLSIGYDYLLYFRRRERELHRREDMLSKNSHELLEHAHHRATVLLARTTEVSEKMLLQSDFLHNDIQAKVDNAMAQIIENNKKMLDSQTGVFDKSYSEDLVQLRSQYVTQIQSVIGEIRTSTEKEIKDFMNVIMKETISAQNYMGTKINEEFETSQKEIAAYKEEQFKKIDESVKAAIVSISQKVLGKAIPMDQHEKLVLDALEQAKREGMFNQ